jgi:hypothetical protein
MSGFPSQARWLLLLLLALGAIGWGGCATSPESDNLSPRPWNTAPGYDNALPGGMYDRYH